MEIELSQQEQIFQPEIKSQYYYLMTVLMLVTSFICVSYLFYHVLMRFIESYRTITVIHTKQNQINKKQQLSQQKTNKPSKLTICGYLILLLLLICVLYQTFSITTSILTHSNGFSPYQALQIQKNASIQQIKRSYRRKMVMYFPDKNHGQDIKLQFYKYAMAYQCLYGDYPKQNCQKYGNPKGDINFKTGFGLIEYINNQGYSIISVIALMIATIVLFVLKIVSKLKQNLQQKQVKNETNSDKKQKNN